LDLHEAAVAYLEKPRLITPGDVKKAIAV